MAKLRALLALSVSALSASPAFAQTRATQTKEPPAPELPPPSVAVHLVAPSATGTWTFSIDNEGDAAVRVPADIRLLTIEVDAYDAKNKKKTVKCSLPAALRPDGFPPKRALLLDAGQSWVEEIDPHLFCFGKDADALAGANAVRARFGWPAPKRLAKGKSPEGPFAIEGVAFPAKTTALKEAIVPSIVLPFRAPFTLAPPDAKSDAPAKDTATKDATAKGSKDKPNAKGDKPDDKPKIVDENAARLEIASDAYANASSPERASVGVTITNAGHRPMTVALLPRMLSFTVEGLDGAYQCDSRASTRAVPRDLYRTLKEGASVRFSVVLAEVCPDAALRRPGLYKVNATLRAGETGAELGLDAYTATVKAKAPTVLRLESGPLPYYAREPRATTRAKPSETKP